MGHSYISFKHLKQINTFIILNNDSCDGSTYVFTLIRNDQKYTLTKIALSFSTNMFNFI